LTQRIQPDHVLSVDGSPVAVLDSKYYAESKSPLDGSWARSRLLSYGFRLDTDCLGMITPLAKQGRYEFKGRPGAMHVIAPKEDSFTTDGFRRAVRGFLKSELGESDELEIRDMLTTHSICHPDVTVHSWEDCLSISELQAEKLVTEVRQILKFATTDARLSDEANPRGTPYLGPLRDFRTYIENDIMAFDIAVPFYISSTDPRAEEILSMDDVPEEEGLNEFIEFHCFNTDDEGVVTSYEVPTPFGMAW
jgi:hypothetical protein